MPNMKDLSLRVKKLWPMLKFFYAQTDRQKDRVITIGHPPSGRALKISVTVYRDIFALGNFSENDPSKGVLIVHTVLFSLFEGLSIETLLQCLIFAVCIFSDLEEVENSAKIKPTRKIPDIQYTFLLPSSWLTIEKPATNTKIKVTSPCQKHYTQTERKCNKILIKYQFNTNKILKSILLEYFISLTLNTATLEASQTVLHLVLHCKRVFY